ncbi:MAG: hypothetical protein K0V04_37730, partial [Deltaproteobacteria bacterium]|nr:hypothetical protein [Deltaproteobacteria bacterium]
LIIRTPVPPLPVDRPPLRWTWIWRRRCAARRAGAWQRARAGLDGRSSSPLPESSPADARDDERGWFLIDHAMGRAGESTRHDWFTVPDYAAARTGGDPARPWEDTPMVDYHAPRWPLGSDQALEVDDVAPDEDPYPLDSRLTAVPASHPDAAVAAPWSGGLPWTAVSPTDESGWPSAVGPAHAMGQRVMGFAWPGGGGGRWRSSFTAGGQGANLKRLRLSAPGVSVDVPKYVDHPEAPRHFDL